VAGLVVVGAAAAVLGTRDRCRPVEVHCGVITVSAEVCGKHLVVPEPVLRLPAEELQRCELDGAVFSFRDGGAP
jgi:hypothetical protein